MSKRTWINTGVTTVVIDGKQVKPGDKYRGDPPRSLQWTHLVPVKSKPRKATI